MSATAESGRREAIPVRTTAEAYTHVLDHGADGAAVVVTCPTAWALRGALDAAATATTTTPVHVHTTRVALDRFGWPGRYRLAGAVARATVSVHTADVSQCRAWSCSGEWRAGFESETNTLVVADGVDTVVSVEIDDPAAYDDPVAFGVPSRRAAARAYTAWPDAVGETFDTAAERGPLRSGGDPPAGLVTAWAVARAGCRPAAAARLGRRLGCDGDARTALETLRREGLVVVDDGRLDTPVGDEPWPSVLLELVDTSTPRREG